MGCSASASLKAAKAQEAKKKAKVVISLTPEEKAIILETWKLIEPYQRIVGKTLFLRFFKEHPTYQDLFPEFRGLSRDDLKSTRVLYGHASRVMKAIETAVASMDNIQAFSAYLEDLGARHNKRALKAAHLMASIVDQ
ncbi:predicted protein [Nematostella vectensis]|uniref:Globin domain-containing protein n=1 Tax=Nematostella vectensis TaxID=45351 RepID=A7RY39_NEMVE|nr:predicted protein [Nematostella vectensis]|eukprot:XP_001635635.1 predicted protein [Nematostella vectensis]